MMAVPRSFDMVVDGTFAELSGLLLRKHADYGSRNVSGSPGGPLNGLRVRIWDKFARINNLVDTGGEAQFEALEDSFIDMACYAVIGVLCLRGQWPE